MLSLLKELIKGVSKKLGLSKSQLFWLSLSMGLVLGIALAVLFQR